MYTYMYTYIHIIVSIVIIIIIIIIIIMFLRHPRPVLVAARLGGVEDLDGFSFRQGFFSKC